MLYLYSRISNLRSLSCWPITSQFMQLLANHDAAIKAHREHFDMIVGTRILKLTRSCTCTDKRQKCQKRYNISRHKCVWAQSCVGTNESGHNRVWAQSCVGTIVSGHKRVWGQSCVGTIVCGHNRVWAQSCVGTIVCGHNRVWAQSCVGTIVCGHNRVGSIVSMGSIMYGPNRDGTIGPTRHDCDHTTVPTHVCAQTRLCLGRHICGQTRLWSETIVPRHVCALTRSP